ncbi:MAG: long-chain fatty acid--CoA ligase [Candidatus Promineifilaceae bacterium]|nr:long-chain fatty acid--CoA ligase [Candidatus Promineifilaceae bacterium]
MYIGDYLGRRAIYSPHKLAIVDAGKEPAWRLTYQEMNARANRLANWLQKDAGIGFGDRVAILARDGVEHLDTFFACGKLGAIHTALNWRLHWRETAQILANTTPSVLIYSDDFREDVAQLRQDPATASVHHYLHLDGAGVPDSRYFGTVLLDSPLMPVANEQVDKETIAALIFTGGTTGLPKAAQISHRMIAWNTLNTVIHDLYHDDVYLNVFPMFHTGGLFVYTLPNVILGGTTILVRQFEPAQVLSLLEEEAVTLFAGVPTMYQMLTQASNWSEADLSALRFCTSGGAPLPVPLVRQYTEEKKVRFKQGFGMTEFGPGLFALAPEDAIEKAGSIGRPTFYVDARIVDDKSNELGPGEVGELVLKGPSRSSGYYNNPEATAEAIDDEGWFHTGDLACYDEEWYFTIVDRKKDMFISGGENVYPAEIEKALYEHPGVHMCAVIGVPDERWGEVGKACVVLKPGHENLSEEALLAHLRERLATYKVPRTVEFMEVLPVSGAGKILKRELRDEFVEVEG